MIHYTESIRGRVTSETKVQVLDLAKHTPGGESGVVRIAVETYIDAQSRFVPPPGPVRRRKRKIS